MACTFDLDHYRELLDAAKAGGYRFACFDREPEEGDLLLRHDVDLALDAAVRLAELEAGADATATYFLMTESVFYNLDSEEGRGAIERLRALGHRVGLHAVYPRAERDDRFDPVVAWHNPDPGVHDRAARRGRERDGAALLRPRPIAPTRTSTGGAAARTTTSRAARSRGSSC